MEMVSLTGRLSNFSKRLTPLISLSAFGLFMAWGAPTDSPNKSIFFTVRSVTGLETVGLRVPKTGTGACELISVSSTVISEPNFLKYTTPSFTTVVLNTNAPSANPVVVTQPYFMPMPSDRAPTQIMLSSLGTYFVLKNIGTLATLNNGNYSNCKLLTYDKDGVIVMYDQGVAKIVLSDLKSESQQRIPLR